VFELGNSLREVRVRQGLDYPQVELATKIRAKYIRAMEDEAFEILPSETYVKGFLRSYAEYLGLDGQLYVDEYNSRYSSDRHYDETPRRLRGTRDHRLERRIVLIALCGIAVLAALVIVAWKYGSGDAGNAVPPTVTQRAPKPQPVHELVLRGTGRGSYVEVHRGSALGALVLAATVGGGHVQRVHGTRFWLAIRKPSNLSVTLNGRHVSLPARKNLKVLVTPTRTKLTTG
jgi:cytoskeleton protein RodZ